MLELELEDYICEYPDSLIDGMTILARQASMPHGRVDILGYDSVGAFNLYVIELKVGTAKARDAAQLTRYAGVMRQRLKRWSAEEGVGFRQAWADNSYLRPILVASSFDRAALQTIDGLPGECFAWKTGSVLDPFVFDPVEIPQSFYPDDWPRPRVVYPWEAPLMAAFQRHLRHEPLWETA